MKLEDVRELVPELRALTTSDVLISGGEPLLNREWREISDLLRDRGFNLWLLTSGLSLAKHADQVAARFKTVTVSIDGTNAETYERIRGVNAFEKVCSGIRAISELGVPTTVRVTLQRANYRELSGFVALAHELGAVEVSFLAVDVGNAHAFSRVGDYSSDLALNADDVTEFRELVDELVDVYEEKFTSRFIAESPEKLRRISDYFAALCDLGKFPEVRCNAPEFSAVIGARGAVSPCFFISGPPSAPRAPSLRAALDCNSMRSLRAAIRDGQRTECERCVCSMWREPAEMTTKDFVFAGVRNA
jgi:MoaA/NifB/PqqE/SkfB family radical SAM enzyme